MYRHGFLSIPLLCLAAIGMYCRFVLSADAQTCVDFVHAFFNSRNGVYRYLSLLLVPQEEGGYELQPHNVAGDPSSVVTWTAPLSPKGSRGGQPFTYDKSATRESIGFDSLPSLGIRII
jgi:hypothetical protein